LEFNIEIELQISTIIRELSTVFENCRQSEGRDRGGAIWCQGRMLHRRKGMGAPAIHSCNIGLMFNKF